MAAGAGAGAAVPALTGGPSPAELNLHRREPGDATNTADPTNPDWKRPIGGMRETYAALGEKMTVPSNERTIFLYVSD